MTVLSNVWVNADGLAVKFCAEEAAVGKVGDYEKTWGHMQIATLHFDYTDIGSSRSILDYNSVIPAGSRMSDIKIWAETAATSGGSATLDVGFIQTDLSTELDYNGLIAAMAITSLDTAGETTTVVVGGTAAGALLGTTLSVDGVFTVNYNTSSFTAGKFIAELRYYLPVTT